MSDKLPNPFEEKQDNNTNTPNKPPFNFMLFIPVFILLGALAYSHYAQNQSPASPQAKTELERLLEQRDKQLASPDEPNKADSNDNQGESDKNEPFSNSEPTQDKSQSLDTSDKELISLDELTNMKDALKLRFTLESQSLSSEFKLGTIQELSISQFERSVLTELLRQDAQARQAFLDRLKALRAAESSKSFSNILFSGADASRQALEQFKSIESSLKNHERSLNNAPQSLSPRDKERLELLDDLADSLVDKWEAVYKTWLALQDPDKTRLEDFKELQKEQAQEDNKALELVKRLLQADQNSGTN